MTLAAWRQDMQEYYASQSLWLQSLPPPTQEVHVTGDVNERISGNVDVTHRWK
jgi:hypothetical protein